MFLLIKHFGTLSFTDHLRHGGGPSRMGGRFSDCDCAAAGAGRDGQVGTDSAVCLASGRDGRSHAGVALIHAATMVTAGIYMVVRTHVIFDRSTMALAVVAIIGAATAFFATTLAMVQTDIKRVLAYSTVSQLGYMFLACGVAAYSAAIFHLVTHAFFKALLFLAAGAVIHSLGGEQDLRHMGGLRKSIPITCWTMLAAFWRSPGFFLLRDSSARTKYFLKRCVLPMAEWCCGS